MLPFNLMSVALLTSLKCVRSGEERIAWGNVTEDCATEMLQDWKYEGAYRLLIRRNEGTFNYSTQTPIYFNGKPKKKQQQISDVC